MTNLTQLTSPQRIGLTAIAFLFALSCIVFGVHLEYASDSTFPLMYRGILNEGVVKTLYIYELYWGELLAWGYSNWPSMPLHGILLFTYSLIALSASICLLLLVTSDFEAFTFVRTVMFLSSIGLLIVHFVGIDFTRIPLLISAVVPLIFISQPVGLLRSALLFVIFITAFWLRPESGKVAIVMVLPSLILAYLNNKSINKKSFLMIFICFIGAFISEQLHDHAYRDNFSSEIKKMYDLHFAFFDAYQRDEDMKHTSPENAARFEAMLIDFQSDKDSLSLEHYASFVKGNVFSLDAFNTIHERISRVSDFFNVLLGRDKGLLLLYFSILLCCTFLLSDRRNSMYLLLHQVYCWGCIVAIVFFIKAAERTYEPMITVAALVSILDLRRMYVSSNTFILRMGMYLLLVVFSLGLASWGRAIFKRSLDYKSNEMMNAYTVDIIKKHQLKYNNIILTIEAFDLFNLGVFKEYTDEGIPFYIHDAHVNYYSPLMEEKLGHFAGDPSVKSFYNKVAEGEYLIIAREKRLKVILNYLKTLYGLNYSEVDVTCEILDCARIDERGVKVFKIISQ